MLPHQAIDGWQPEGRWLSRDARAKLAVLLGFLIAVSTTPNGPFLRSGFWCYAALLAAAMIRSKLSLEDTALHLAMLLPIPLMFAGVAYWSGDASRALTLLGKGGLSAAAAVLFARTTPLLDWVRALEQWHCPQLLILVLQFLYRYLFLMIDEAQRMAQAARLRRGPGRGLLGNRRRFTAAGRAVSVLFSRGWKRAEDIHRAMLARGFDGQFPTARKRPFTAADALFLFIGLFAPLSIRFVSTL